MVCGLPVQMAQGLLKHLFQKFRLHANMHGAVFDACDGQKVLCQVHKPHRVIVNSGVQLLLFFLWKLDAFFHQHAGISADAGERRAQIVRNGAQQVGAQALALRLHLNGLFFRAQAAAL